jgi:hypothetical protein
MDFIERFLNIRPDGSSGAAEILCIMAICTVGLAISCRHLIARLIHNYNSKVACES